MRSLLLASLIFASGCSGANGESNPSTPTAEDMKSSEFAQQGAFEAADEVCIGDGDISDSLRRATETGWKRFEPVENSMMGKLEEAYLEGGEYPPPKVILLRKNENRAAILLFQLSGPLGSNYLHECRVYEENAAKLDVLALQSWAAVPINPAQAEADKTDIELVGGRFANKPGGLAKAGFIKAATPEWPAKGLVLSFLRSDSAPEGN